MFAPSMSGPCIFGQGCLLTRTQRAPEEAVEYRKMGDIGDLIEATADESSKTIHRGALDAEFRPDAPPPSTGSAETDKA